MQPTPKDSSQPQTNSRLLALHGLVGLIMAVFVMRLWTMQIAQAGYYQSLADSNRFRLTTIDAPRGIIYDRNGVLLARNTPIYDVMIVPAYLPDDAAREMAIYERLSQLLDLPVSSKSASLAGAGQSGIKDIVDAARGVAPYRPVTIQTDVPRDVALQIMEESLSLPGVQTLLVSGRDYPLGLLTSHVVGYTGGSPRLSSTIWRRRSPMRWLTSTATRPSR